MSNDKPKAITKAELSEILGISDRTRSRYMNVLLYSEIRPLGYQKNSRLLNARVVEFMRQEFLSLNNEND